MGKYKLQIEQRKEGKKEGGREEARNGVLISSISDALVRGSE